MNMGWPKGKKQTIGHRKKIRNSLTTPEQIERVRKLNTGRKHSTEIIEVIRKASQNRRMSQHSRNKISDTLKGRPLSESRRLKIVDATKRAMSKPDVKQKMREGLQFARKQGKMRQTSNTRIERDLQQFLTELGVKYETQVALIGQPDIFIEPNICIFADGDYWHTLEKQMSRDAHVNSQLQELGYTVYRFWEHDIVNRPDFIRKQLYELLT